MEIQTEWSLEEAALRDKLTFNSYTGKDSLAYSEGDADDASLEQFTYDAISCAAGHPAMVGHAVIKAWHDRRITGYKMNVQTRCQHVNIVGELAIVGGIFRISRQAEEGVPGLEHGGRWLSVMKQVDGE